MLRTLNIDTRVPTVHGALIRRQAVDEQVRAYSTVNAARAHARTIVKQALAKAEQIEQHAMKTGFQAGWQNSLNAIATALQDTDRFYKSVDENLKRAVQEALTKTVSQPELALHLIEGWLDANSSVAGKLQVIVPKHAASQVDAIKNRLRASPDVSATVSIGTSDSVVIQFNDQGVEFSPERTTDEINALVQRCFQSLAVKKQCATWSREITQSWVDGLARSHGEQQETASAGSHYDVREETESYGEPLRGDQHDVAHGAPRSAPIGEVAGISYEEQMDQEFFGDFEDDLVYEHIE